MALISLHNISIFAKDFPFSSGILHEMLTDEWSYVLTHISKSLWLMRGARFQCTGSEGGGKNVVRDYRGGPRFECERFSEFHRNE